DALSHPYPEPRPAGRGALWLGRGSREQCHRGPCLQPAQEAGRALHRHRAQPGLRAGTGMNLFPWKHWKAAQQKRHAHWSLRRRLLLMVMGTSIALWLVSLAIVIGVAWFATSEVFDEALEEGARLVLQLGSESDAAVNPRRELNDGRGEA